MSAELLETLQHGVPADSLPAGSNAIEATTNVPAPQIPDTLSILPLRGFVIFPERSRR